jgi:hypothetical protein
MNPYTIVSKAKPSLTLEYYWRYRKFWFSAFSLRLDLFYTFFDIEGGKPGRQPCYIYTLSTKSIRAICNVESIAGDKHDVCENFYFFHKDLR